jgi:hypothetical protein
MILESVVAKRPLPSLAQWLDSKNGGKRAPGYEPFAALVDLAERTILQTDAGLPVEHACFLRLWQGMCIAAVELCNIEHEKDVGSGLIVTMLPRALACAAVYAVASVARDDAPLRDIAKLLTEEFRFAAKGAADGLMSEAK